jgi:hypothetical protein
VLIDERASQALGRWRRQYDPEGDEPRLGWGEEPLLSLPEGVVAEGVVAEGVVAEGVVAEGIVAAAAAQGAGINGEDKGAADENVAPSDPWVPLRVRLLHGEAELVTTERMPSTGGGSSSSSAGAGVGGLGSSAADMPADAVARAAAAKELELAELAGAVLSALAEWEALARDSATYANVDVACAELRVQNGFPALRRDPAALLDGVKLDLGPRPDARAQPTAFALWVPALLNPLPALGVASELRASVLIQDAHPRGDIKGRRVCTFVGDGQHAAPSLPFLGRLARRLESLLGGLERGGSHRGGERGEAPPRRRARPAA